MKETETEMRSDVNGGGLSWWSIIRLGVVQSLLGAIVVLTTSTLNRVMVIELALPAVVPGALVTLHHAAQMLRPRMGHGSDVGRRHTPWIIGGMASLAIGGAGAAAGTALMATHLVLGLLVAVAAFALIGAGVSACGTNLLVLMAKKVSSERRAPAATVVWTMMIAGFAITATLAGRILDPYSPSRLVAVATGVSAIAFVGSVLAILGVEGDGQDLRGQRSSEGRPDFRTALREVWADPDARHFTLFVFVSMLAYSAQDLILEPFAGSIFHLTPGETTRLSGAQHGGVLAGMVVMALAAALFKKTRLSSLKGWVVGGCLASAISMVGLVLAAFSHGAWPLTTNVFVLGVSNGAFSIAAIGSMMTLAGEGRQSREGIRMGVWGAAQAIAFGTGGFAGTVMVDGAKLIAHTAPAAYALVFSMEALGFVFAYRLAMATAFGPRAEGKVEEVPMTRAASPGLLQPVGEPQ
jgi:BCD family chlorophyll transporter-like MFS transporter